MKKVHGSRLDAPREISLTPHNDQNWAEEVCLSPMRKPWEREIVSVHRRERRERRDGKTISL